MMYQNFLYNWQKNQKEPDASSLSLEDKEILLRGVFKYVFTHNPSFLKDALSSQLSKDLMSKNPSGKSLLGFKSNRRSSWWWAFSDAFHNYLPSEKIMSQCFDFLLENPQLLSGRCMPHIMRGRICSLLMFTRDQGMSKLFYRVLEKANKEDKRQFFRNSIASLKSQSNSNAFQTFAFLYQTMNNQDMKSPEEKFSYHCLLDYALSCATEEEIVQVNTLLPDALKARKILTNIMIESHNAFPETPLSQGVLRNIDMVLSNLPPEDQKEVYKKLLGKVTPWEHIPFLLRRNISSQQEKALIYDNLSPLSKEKTVPKKPKM